MNAEIIRKNVRLNKLVTKLTAFASWADMVKAMETHGYIPSIYGSLPGKQKKLKAELCELIRERGYKVFDGVKSF